MKSKVKIDLIEGVDGYCLTIDDYRVAGPKPWAGGTTKETWMAEKKDLLAAIDTDGEIERLNGIIDDYIAETAELRSQLKEHGLY